MQTHSHADLRFHSEDAAGSAKLARKKYMYSDACNKIARTTVVGLSVRVYGHLEIIMIIIICREIKYVFKKTR